MVTIALKKEMVHTSEQYSLINIIPDFLTMDKHPVLKDSLAAKVHAKMALSAGDSIQLYLSSDGTPVAAGAITPLCMHCLLCFERASWMGH